MKALGEGSGAHVTLDFCVHAWIIAFHLDGSVAGNQPKPVVSVVHVTLTMTKKVEQHICIKFARNLATHAQKPMIWFRKLLGMRQWAVHKLKSGLGSSKTDVGRER